MYLSVLSICYYSMGNGSPHTCSTTTCQDGDLLLKFWRVAHIADWWLMWNHFFCFPCRVEKPHTLPFGVCMSPNRQPYLDQKAQQWPRPTVRVSQLLPHQQWLDQVSATCTEPFTQRYSTNSQSLFWLLVMFYWYMGTCTELRHVY